MSKKILLADNSRIALLLRCRALSERTTHDIVIATDGNSAIEKALAELPDLILMDTSLPEKDGIAACIELRRDLRTASTPIVLLSNLCEKKHVDAAFGAGCSDYLLKPIDESELIGVLEAYLDL
jgi:CheY-like chemotaxis protein